MMRRLLILALIFVAFACGEKNAPPTDTTDTSATTETTATLDTTATTDTQPPPCGVIYETWLREVPRHCVLSGDEVWRYGERFWIRAAGDNSLLPPGGKLVETIH
jgi:hypothetical protein